MCVLGAGGGADTGRRRDFHCVGSTVLSVRQCTLKDKDRRASICELRTGEERERETRVKE